MCYFESADAKKCDLCNELQTNELFLKYFAIYTRIFVGVTQSDVNLTVTECSDS